MQDSSDDELFVGLGDLSVAVDDDSAADVAEPSSTELDAFRAVELACLEGRRINAEAGGALSIASGWYAKTSEGAYGAVIQDPLLKAVVERPPLKVSAIADRCETSLTATAIRYAELTDSAVAVIMSTGGVIDYCFLSEAMKSLPKRDWLRKGSPLPAGTATSRSTRTRFASAPSRFSQASMAAGRK